MARQLNAGELLGTLTVADTAAFDTDALARRAQASLEARELNEFWKYTPVQSFVSELVGQTPRMPELSGQEDPGVEVSTIAPSQSLAIEDVADGASVGRFPLADLALLITGNLVHIRVSRTPQRPLTLTWPGGLCLPVLIDVQPGVAFELIETAPEAGFANQSIYLHLAERARVTHASTSLETESNHWSLTQVQQAAGSVYQRQQYQRGGRRRRTETHILLSGAGASASITGAFLVDGGTHLDQQLVIEHRARDTRSRQKFHGIGAGKGQAVFNGRIHIHPGAPGSDAALSNRNLALDADAIINTKPELEIYTDDVRCAHGATVGQISEESLFYLASRGLDPQSARHMLCRAFVRECIEGPLAEAAEQNLLAAWQSEPRA